MNRGSGRRDGLLARLARNDGLENYITEALCWLLSHTGFGDRFLRKLGEVGDGCLPVMGPDRSWTTQKSFWVDGEYKRPDMVCESAGSVAQALIFEHKVGAELGKGQLGDYQRIGEERYRDAYGLILITARMSQRDSGSGVEPNRHLVWRDVHGWLHEWLEDNEKDHNRDNDEVAAFVGQSFLRLLEERGLGPLDKITTAQMRAIPRARVAQQRIGSLVDRVAVHPAWEALPLPGEYRVAPSGVHDAWGRRGFYLLGNKDPGSWRPGVFVGVLYHASDHGPPAVNDEEGSGPVACLVFDVARSWHGRYEASEPYGRLVRVCAERWSGSGDGWLLHKEQGKPWHPLAVYKPLESVLSGAQSGDAQVNRFVEDLSRVVEEALQLDELWELRRHLLA